jgi:hypothetical protein
MHYFCLFKISFSFIFEGPFVSQIDVSESHKTVITVCTNHFVGLKKRVNLLLHDLIKSNVYLQKYIYYIYEIA